MGREKNKLLEVKEINHKTPQTNNQKYKTNHQRNNNKQNHTKPTNKQTPQKQTKKPKKTAEDNVIKESGSKSITLTGSFDISYFGNDISRTTKIYS